MTDESLRLPQRVVEAEPNARFITLAEDEFYVTLELKSTFTSYFENNPANAAKMNAVETVKVPVPKNAPPIGSVGVVGKGPTERPKYSPKTVSLQIHRAKGIDPSARHTLWEIEYAIVFENGTEDAPVVETSYRFAAASPGGGFKFLKAVNLSEATGVFEALVKRQAWKRGKTESEDPSTSAPKRPTGRHP